jgi:antitoxin YefM
MDPFHERLARLALEVAADYGFCLAGGYAVQAHGFVDRVSKDVDLFPELGVKNRLSEVVDRLEREHGRVVITKHGRPAAVVLSVDDLESLEETLHVMGNTAVLADLREALTELASADAPVLTKDQALGLISGQ